MDVVRVLSVAVGVDVFVGVDVGLAALAVFLVGSVGLAGVDMMENDDNDR